MWRRLRSGALLALIVIALAAGRAAAHDPSRYGGVFRSRNMGANWLNSDVGLFLNAALVVAVDPRDPMHLMIGTDCRRSRVAKWRAELARRGQGADPGRGLRTRVRPGWTERDVRRPERRVPRRGRNLERCQRARGCVSGARDRAGRRRRQGLPAWPQPAVRERRRRQDVPAGSDRPSAGRGVRPDRRGTGPAGAAARRDRRAPDAELTMAAGIGKAAPRVFPRVPWKRSRPIPMHPPASGRRVRIGSTGATILAAPGEPSGRRCPNRTPWCGELPPMRPARPSC